MALSVGGGISLGGRNPSELPYINELSKYDSENARRGSVSAKSQDELDKLYKDIHIPVNKFHAIQVPEIQKDVAETWGRVMDAYRKDPVNYRGAALNEFQGLADRGMKYQAQHEQLSMLDKIPESELTAPQREYMNKVHGGGSMADLMKMESDPLGSMVVGKDGIANFGYKLDKGRNYTGEAQNILRNIDTPPLDAQGNPTSQFVAGKPIEKVKGSGAYFTPVVETTPIPEDVAKSKLADYWVNNQNLHLNEMEANRADIMKGVVKVSDNDIRPVKNPDGSINKDALESALHDKWFNNVSQGNMTKTKGVTYEAYTPPATKGGTTPFSEPSYKENADGTKQATNMLKNGKPIIFEAIDAQDNPIKDAKYLGTHEKADGTKVVRIAKTINPPESTDPEKIKRYDIITGKEVAEGQTTHLVYDETLKKGVKKPFQRGEVKELKPEDKSVEVTIEVPYDKNQDKADRFANFDKLKEDYQKKHGKSGGKQEAPAKKDKPIDWSKPY